MRGVGLVALVVLSGLSGCLTFLDDDDAPARVRPADVGYDPSLIRVTSVVKHAADVTSFDGTPLSVVVYEPRSEDLAPGGTPPTWGTVLFLHGWGLFKETYEGFGGATGAPVPEGQGPYTDNRLQAFAEAGLIAVAYDARGFGRSGGTSTVAGAAELQDLEAVRQWTEDSFPSNGLFGIVGKSYGGGQALLALTDNPRITTVAPQYGWVDLYQGLLPGNVPKAQWAALLSGLGTAGAAEPNPTVADWLQRAATRTDLDGVAAEMEVRSAQDRLASVTKPLLLCQGMQETLFPQVDQAWTTAGGFTRALVFTGGHGADDPECWDLTERWMRYFLGGHPDDVPAWPALRSVDASGARAVDFARFPAAVETPYFLDAPNLERGYPSNATFTISQRLLANPLAEPSALWDQAGRPNNAIPEQLRQDPAAVTFETAPFSEAEVVLGAPWLELVFADPDPTLPVQVTAQLLHVDAAGMSRVLTRGAIAALAAEDVANGTTRLDMHWVKADVSPGDKLVLKLAANDPSWFLPLPANYQATFVGRSQLHLPFFEGEFLPET